jgi:hypothetical protein
MIMDGDILIKPTVAATSKSIIFTFQPKEGLKVSKSKRFSLYTKWGGSIR